MNQLLIGAVAALCLVAGLLFWRYWRSTRDRFFVFFALSFWIEAASRIHIGATMAWDEDAPLNYLVRLLAYALILFAIWDKNRPRGKP